MNAGSAEPTRPHRLVAATGDPADPQLMSGRPHHLWRYGMTAGLIDGAATRRVPERGAGWALWNARQAIRGQRLGGYRFTPEHVRKLWLPLGSEQVTVVNCFQIYPDHLLEATNVRRWYFLDQTLGQLFRDYRSELRLGSAIERTALDRERIGFERADHIITISRWARDDVIDRYGIDPARVSVINQAANLDPSRYESWLAKQLSSPPEPHDELRLVFVGVQWERKGLDRLLSAMRVVNGGGVRITLDVIGPAQADVPTDLADTPGVRWHGYLRKGTEEDRFFEIVGAADVGCLLSRAEGGGNCIREFHSMGLAVLGTAAGGSAEQTLPDASWIVDVDESVDDIAGRLKSLCDDRSAVERAKAAAWEQRTTVLWDHALAQFAALFAAHGA